MMKYSTLVLFFALAFSSVSFAQTKRIAHRSHSGADATLRYSGADNFGLPFEVDSIFHAQRQARLDSLRAADSLKAIQPFKDTMRLDTGKLKKQPAPKKKDKKNDAGASQALISNGVPDWVLYPGRL
jgi:hypothetical protein